ncbi:choline dehydrogenase [Thalassobaculum sp.]|uniref:GMC family oxidoreductase n=1 Tax=Thalassobaculum sp. TaxID=2022740 RepID=UPI0032EEFCB2
MRAYDYVIVGAGSAGCVLASRLTEDPGVSVLLLEAGGWDWNPLIHIPLGVGKLVRSNLHSWGYWTEPEPHLDDRRLYWPRGKVVGGSSSINSMIYIRGHPRDYDTWAQLGNRGWAWDDVLPYFRRSEGHVDRLADDLHGTRGPLKVKRGRDTNPLYDVFAAAGRQAGYRDNDDFNGPSQEGLGRYDFTIHNGRRASAAACYLRPALKRPNLTVETGALTHRVLVEGGRTTGVEYHRHGTLHRVTAGREVLLAGGALNSPQVLMLSGIGDPEELGAHGIPVVHALPGVGRDLQDHLDIPLQFACPKPVTLHSLVRLDRAALAMAQAALFRTGPATSFPAEGGLFVRTRPELEMPDMQWHFLIGLGAKRVRIPLLWQLNRGPMDRDGFTIRMCQLRPESRGRVRLRSDDPADRVRILANYYSTEADRRSFRDGLRMARELVAQPAFDGWRDEELNPGPDVISDSDIDAYVRRISETIYHPVGTCRMGVDDGAVVDPELKVRGLEGLRVIDASIMPRLIGGNTNAPTMMIAEKAVDMMLGRTTMGAADAQAV